MQPGVYSWANKIIPLIFAVLDRNQLTLHKPSLAGQASRSAGYDSSDGDGNPVQLGVVKEKRNRCFSGTWREVTQFFHLVGNGCPPINMIKIEQQNDLEKELHVHILSMMAGNFDRWQPDADPESVSAMVKSDSLAAAGIAHKLSKAIAEYSSTLTPRVWRKMVTDATRNSFVEFSDSEPMIKLGENPSFVRVVEECTASVVAPSGSEWARKLDKRQEQRLRKSLSRFKLPPRVVDEVVKGWAEESRRV